MSPGELYKYWEPDCFTSIWLHQGISKTDCKTSLFKFINMLDTAKDPIFLIHKRSLSFAWLFGWPNSQLSRKCLSSKIKLAEQRIWKQYQGGSKYGRRTCGIFCENYSTRDILSLTRLNLSANLLDILWFACRWNIAQNLLAERCTEFICKAWQRGSILNQLNVIFCSYIFLWGKSRLLQVLSVQLWISRITLESLNARVRGYRLEPKFHSCA